MRSFTEEQAGAVARREGPLLLAAGAGSGKTSVLVERFVRSVLDDGLRPGQILAITFTEKAAGELRSRVRARFLALGEREAARETESAWIGTIHGFCTRVLRGHAVAAGLDPAFVVLDDTIARELRATAWRRAYATWIDDGGDAAVDVAAAYGVDRLEEAIGEVHDALRSAGATVPALPSIPPVAPVAEARAAVHRAIPAAQAELAAAKPGARVATAQEAVLAGRTFPTYKMEALCGPGCTAYRDAVERLATAERDERAAGVAARLGDLLTAYATAFADAKTARAGLDFDDLQLHARDLLRDDASLRASYADRFARVMVDEFQDTNPLQLELVDLLAPDGAFVVGDEQQSIYGFRHADVEVFRGRRATLGERGATATLQTNFRSAAGDPRGGERRVRAALRRRVHGAAARAGARAVDRARRGAPAHRHGRMGRRGPRRSPARPGLAPRGGAAAGPAGRASSSRAARPRRRTSSCCCAPSARCRSSSARCRTSGCPRWRSAGAGTGAARSCAISAAGWRSSPTRATRSRSTACWPRRSSGRRPTPSPSSGRPARPGRATRGRRSPRRSSRKGARS